MSNYWNKLSPLHGTVTKRQSHATGGRVGLRDRAFAKGGRVGLKKGDKVITKGGLIGTISNIKGKNKEILELNINNTKIDILKSYINSTYSK